MQHSHYGPAYGYPQKNGTFTIYLFKTIQTLGHFQKHNYVMTSVGSGTLSRDSVATSHLYVW